MKRPSSRMIATAAVWAVALGANAFAAQDRYALKVPEGLSFGEFRGYQSWQTVAVSQVKEGSREGLKVISANPEMIAAFKKGLPANGKTFPDGSKVVKIEWLSKQNPVSPYFVMVPDTLKSVAFILKDTKRFPKTNGWAYASFAYDPASDSFKPDGAGAECGYACHSKVSAQDYIFTAYPRR